MERQIQGLVLTLLVPCLLWYFLHLSIIQCVLICILLLLTLHHSMRNEDLPPGPTNIPIASTISIMLAEHPYEYIANNHKKYGAVITLPIGKTPFISVNSYEMMKELSVHPDLQIRPEIPPVEDDKYKIGISATSGNVWKHQRRFLMHSLRDAGMGKLKLQEKIQQELTRLMCVLEKSEGEPTEVHFTLAKSTSSIICSIAFNQQFGYDDKRLTDMLNALKTNLNLVAFYNVIHQFFFLKPFLFLVRNRILSNFNVTLLASKKFIKEHKESFDPNCPRDIIDHYLVEMNKATDETKEDGGYHDTFFEEQLQGVILDLFVGGTETISTTICWALLYMINYPDIQEKVRSEIDEIVGSGRYPGMEDKTNLPFTTATLQEIERLGSVLPQSLVRTCKKPLHFENYVFPPQSVVSFNLYSIHRDPNLWINPLDFNPTRFIDSDGKTFRPAHLAAFGSGKRNCAGEAFGKMEIFLYFTTLIQKFVFEAVDKTCPPPLRSSRSLMRSPIQYKIRCIRR